MNSLFTGVVDFFPKNVNPPYRIDSKRRIVMAAKTAKPDKAKEKRTRKTFSGPRE